MRLEHVDPANLTDAFVSLLDLLTDVPGAASYLPFMNASVTAKCPSRRRNRTVAPSTDWLAASVALGLSPLFSGDDTGPASAHALSYRHHSVRSLAAVRPSLRPSRA